MKYKATKKCKTLSRANAHQGLDKVVFDKLMDGKTVDFNPPGRLIENKYLKKVEAENGN